MGLRIFTGAAGSKFVCDDGGFGETVVAISMRANAPITSCAREKAAEPFLLELGKMSQKQLFDCATAFNKTKVCPEHCHGNCNRNAHTYHDRDCHADGYGYTDCDSDSYAYTHTGPDHAQCAWLQSARAADSGSLLERCNFDER